MTERSKTLAGRFAQRAFSTASGNPSDAEASEAWWAALELATSRIVELEEVLRGMIELAERLNASRYTLGETLLKDARTTLAGKDTTP